METKRLWAVVVFFAGILEAIGLKQKGKNDTLSEYTWSKTNNPIVRALVGALVGWLPYHFTYGNGVPLSWRDAAFAGGGLLLGIGSWLAGRRRR